MAKMMIEGGLSVLILTGFVSYIDCAVSFTQPTKIPPAYEDVYVQEGSDAKLVWIYSVGSRDELDEANAVAWNTFFPRLTTAGINRKALIFEKGDGTRKNSTSMPSYLTGRISIEDPATLVISNVKTTDENFYECLLTPSASITLLRSLIRLNVISANIVEHPKSAICPGSGGEVAFTCNATGTPLPNVTWVKNGEEIVNSSSIKIVGDGNGYSELTVGNCENEGQLASYQCKATNLLDVKKDSKTAILFFGFTTNGTDEVDKYSSPSVVNASIGEETTLRCAFRSYPPPFIKWTFPDGSSTQTRLPFLVIIPKSNEQFGNYTCSAKGFTSRTMLLTTGKGNATITNAHNNSVSWKADPRADYYVIYGTAEGEQSFCYLAIEQTNSLLLHWDSTCEVERKKKKRLVLTLEVRAQAQGKEFNYVVHRARVTLEAKARSLQGGFLAIVVPLAVGLLSAGLQ